MNRHDGRLNGAGPIEYLLSKLSNLAFYRRLTTCKTHHNNNILGSKSTQFMLNKTMLITRNR